MQKEDLKTLLFATAVCVVCSLLLASTHAALKSKQELNKTIDGQINILKAFRPATDAAGKPLSDDQITSYFDNGKVPREQITQYFDTYVKEWFIDLEGNLLEGKTRADFEETAITDKHRSPNILYTWEKDGIVEKYVFPSEGKGLWSTVHSYVGLKQDLSTIQGITFFDHGETPGLGGECSKPWFQANFRGKQMMEGNQPAEFEVLKGKVADIYPNGNAYAVDGMSGATITGKGIQNFLNEDFRSYNNYFSTIRK